MNQLMQKAPMALAAGLLAAGLAQAKVPASEAERLGKDLTCTGAIKAGNKEGTIPEFTGKWLGAPPGVAFQPSSGKHPVDIYANEKPLFQITADNMGQYLDKLSPGQQSMLKKYAKTYRIPVYQGHRDFRFSDEVCAVSKKNALDAEVAENGLSIKGRMGAVNFPIPKNGLELIWNNLLNTREYTAHVIRDNANVLSNGTINYGRTDNTDLDRYNVPELLGKPVDGPMAYSFAKYLLPERDRGGVTVAVEPTNFGDNKRLTWAYEPGTRRVRQIPEFGFDQPMAGTGGRMTIDSDRLFNGSPERYNWKLVGRKEMFIPANAYRVHQPSVKYASLLTPEHPNPDYLRYELRRVWVTEGTLKEGYRHLFGKRVMFLDEDTGQAVATDIYDARGELWQHAFINYYYAFDVKAWYSGTSFYHDLTAGSYLAYNLFQERESGPVLNKGDLNESMFTPAAARSAGK